MDLTIKASCRKVCGSLFMASLLLFPVQAYSDLAVTDNCQDEVKELEEKIEKDRDEYSADSRSKARAELARAKTNRLDPIKCRKNVQDARQELRKGKRDKKKDD